MVHVIQNENFNRLVGNPLEWVVADAAFGEATVPRWIRPGIVQIGWLNSLNALGLLDGYRHPFEMEAQWVEYH